MTEESKETFEEFFDRTTKRCGKGIKKHKVRNCWGVYDAYKLLRKHKWLNIGRPLKEHEFYSIVRGVNKCLAEEILEGKTIKFPARMGEWELRKFKHTVSFVDGKLRTSHPVDWMSTIKLWYADEDARQKRQLVRFTSGGKYKLLYKKFLATYQNRIFYQFIPNTFIRQKLGEKINNGEISTIW